MTEAFIGIDWGTHSSKWCYQDSTGKILFGDIWDSRVWRVENNLAMHPFAAHFSGGKAETELKRRLIDDPNQPFWEGPRATTGVTLGESVVFSLATLVLDVSDSLREAGIDPRSLDPIHFRFSHPNWIRAESVRALQLYRDAAVIAVGLFKSGVPEAKRHPAGGIVIPIQSLKPIIDHREASLEGLAPFPTTYDYKGYRLSSQGLTDGLSWQMVFESCVAGFPYLVEAEPETFSGDDSELQEQLRFRKILVVDVGAGSTDVGYMLRTLKPDPKTGKPSEPMLIALPAAPALEKAGKWLTDRILEDFEAEGHAVTSTEAEAYKIGPQMNWADKPYVNDWSEFITGHIGKYVRKIPDEKRLPKPPKLEIALTGGSSVVAPLRATLLQGVKNSLEGRGINAEVVETTELLTTPVSSLAGRGYSEIEVAQLAVCLGASDPRLSKIKHYSELRETVVAVA